MRTAASGRRVFFCSVGALLLARLLAAATLFAGDAAGAADAAAAPAAALARLKNAGPPAGEGHAVPSVDAAFRTDWQTVADAGPEGLALVRAELAKLPKNADDEDSYFRILAGALLWRLAGIDAADEIGRLWSDPELDLDLAPSIVHAAAYQAARARDPRVLPVLFASFRATEAFVTLPRGDLSLQWPETCEFVWASFGPGGRAALLKLLIDSKDENQRATAAWLLARDAYLPALPALRGLARGRAGFDRDMAVHALGVFGHPDDFEFLAAGLYAAARRGALDADAEVFLDAAVEYGDLRFAPSLANLLAALSAAPAPGTEIDGDALEAETARDHVRSAILDLLTVEGLAAFRGHASNLKGPERANVDALVAGVFAGLGLPAHEYDALPPDEKADAVALHHDIAQADYQPVPADAHGPRELWHHTLARLRDGPRSPFGAADGEEFDGLPPRRLIAIATPADLDDLLEARAAVARRPTREALEILDVVNAIAIRIARLSYRQQAGVSPRVTTP